MKNDKLKVVTGHGGRACFVTESLLHGVTTAAIVGQTGHANEQSMRPYARTSAEAERVLQDVIAGMHRLLPKLARPTSQCTKQQVTNGRKALGGKPDRLPGSPTKIGLRDAKKAKTVASSCAKQSAIEIIDSDEEKGKVKVEEEEGGRKGKGGGEAEVAAVEELKKQLEEQRKESAELKQKLDKVLQDRSAVCGGALDLNAALPGMPAHQMPPILHGSYGAMGTMNNYNGSHFGMPFPPPPQYPVFSSNPTPMPVSSHYPMPGQVDWNGRFPSNERRPSSNDDSKDEKSKKSTFNFSCTIS